MAKKKVNRKKNTTQKSRNKKAAQSQNKQTASVLLFAVGLLLAALTLIPGGNVWYRLHSLFFGMMGKTAYFLAPLCIYIAVAIAKDQPIEAVKTKLWQAGILLFLISGTIEVFGGLPKVEGFGPMVAALFKEGVEKRGGGVIGIITAGPLSFIDSSPGPQIIILLALFVFIMLVTGSSLITLFKAVKKPVKNIENAYNTGMEKMREKKELEFEQKMFEQQELLARQEKEAAYKPQEFNYVVPPDDGISEERKKVVENVARIMPKFDIDIDISGDKLPEELEKEEPLETIMVDMASKNINEPDKSDPFATFGLDQPVEYITTPSYKLDETFELRSEPVVVEERAHPLEQDIEKAYEKDVTAVIHDYLAKIKTDNYVPETPKKPVRVEEPEPEPEIETIKADIFWEDTPQDILSEDENTGEDWQDGIEKEILSNIIEEPDDTMRLGFEQPKTVERVPEPEPESYDDFDESVIAPPPINVKEKALEKTKTGYKLPPVDLLEKPEVNKHSEDITQELKENAEKLVKTLESFGVETKVIDIARGPAVTRYELQPSAGVKISRITGLADDIALNLAAAGIRIEAPIPNKAAVGIEVPNKNISMVRIREIIESSTFKDSKSIISMALGKDITGNIKVADISKMPHMLIAGATGSGKSVCINSIIMSVLYKYSPDEVKLLMIDPKVVELGVYNGIPHLLVPVVTDPKKAAGALNWAVNEMLNRYKAFAENSVRDIAGYNRIAGDDPEIESMPHIVIIIDELSDLMMAAPGEVEDSICRLAQMARAAGMHLVIATQRPSVDVITGVIKANIPSRVAFAVSSQIDSRTILDSGGAEKLLGRGDMLFYPVGAAKPLRVQGCFVSDVEVERVVDFVKSNIDAEYDEDIADEIDRLSVGDKSVSSPLDPDFDDEDEFIPYALECIVDAEQASTSLLQRRLKIGYARAARIMDQLEARGIVGPSEGSKPRDLLIDRDRYIEMKLAGLDQPGAMRKPIEVED